MWRLILVLVSLLLLAWGIFISVGGPQTPTALGTLAKFSGCMTKQNFVDSEMYRWANKDAEGSTCSSCHQDGLARFNTNPDRNIMFTMNRYEVFILGFFTVAVDPITAENKVVIDKAKLENKGKGGATSNSYGVKQ